jgi:hypothetical protein
MEPHKSAAFSGFLRTERRWAWIGWALWLIPGLVIAVLVAVQPHHRTVTPIYHEAVANWWARQPVYTGPSGFNYLPLFLPLFGLFGWLPFVVCDVLWRWAALAGLGIGLWRCSGLMVDRNRFRAFTIVTVLSLPICLSALRNGQSSAQLAASLVLATWCLHTQRWGWATLWLCLSLVCKPLGIVAVGLALMTFPRLWWRLAIGLAVVAAAPYLFGPPAYVNGQYAAFAKNISQCFDTSRRSFADLNGILMVLNLKLTGLPSLIVRAAAGAALAVACWFAGTFGADLRRAFLWLGFTGAYIMLFTPMNESNSYVMLAPALGLWAWWHVEHGATRTAQALAVMALTMALLPNLIRPVFGRVPGNQFAKFWDPFMALIFLGILLWRMKPAPGGLRQAGGEFESSNSKTVCT